MLKASLIINNNENARRHPFSIIAVPSRSVMKKGVAIKCFSNVLGHQNMKHYALRYTMLSFPINPNSVLLLARWILQLLNLPEIPKPISAL